MGWQDDPIVEPAQNAQPAWMSDPVVEERQSPQEQPPNESPGVFDRAMQMASMQHPIATGAVEMAAHAGSGALATPLAGIAGILGGILPGQRGQAANVTEAMQGGLTYQPRSPVGQVFQKVGGLLPGLIAEGGDAAGQAAADASGSPAAGAAVNTGVQMLPALLLRGRAGKMAGNVNSRVTNPPGAARSAAPAQEAAKAVERQPGLAGVPKAAPSLEELSKAADEAYKRADEAGIVVKESSLKGLKTRIVSMTKKEGIDSDLHPDATAALNKIIKSKGDLTLSELETLRKVASDAKGSIKPADRRIADKITEQLDDYIDDLADGDVVAGDAVKAKALKEARGLYSRKKKAEEINKLVEDAKTSAANFSGSGLENALRTEFRKLAKNEKRMRRFTKEEQAAIKKVATGGSKMSAANITRFIGKFAPTGVVSGVLSGGAGAIIGGPLGAALPLAGLGGRAIATRITKGNAAAAEELMRRGRSLEPEKKRNKLAEPVTY
jgi:hypothetical protein